MRRIGASCALPVLRVRCCRGTLLSAQRVPVCCMPHSPVLHRAWFTLALNRSSVSTFASLRELSLLIDEPIDESHEHEAQL